AAHDVLAEVPCGIRFGECLFETLIDIPDFAVDIVVANGDAHGIGANRHALNQSMRVVAQDIAILEGAGLTLVGIADKIFLAGVILRHETPLEASWKTCATASA